jgi:hypothetical protein
MKGHPYSKGGVMREIKFRALLENETGRWWEYYTTLHEPAWSSPFFGAEVVVKDLQFTGLLDKNGREIYEGDIVSDGMWQSYGCLNGTHEVKFEDGGFYPFCVPKWECTMDIKGCEIIGNIHENPEVLS